MSMINMIGLLAQLELSNFGGCRQTCCNWSNTIFDVNLTESGDNHTCIAVLHIDLFWVIHKQQVKATTKKLSHRLKPNNMLLGFDT